MVTLADPVLVGSDCKTAVTVTVGWIWNRMSEPCKARSNQSSRQSNSRRIWFTCQLTAALEAFCTTALNCTFSPWKGLRRIWRDRDCHRRRRSRPGANGAARSANQAEQEQKR